MAAVAFDPMEYAQQLESAGMPRAQAEVVARGLTAMFIHNFDSLVTKDYLDTRFTGFETRIESKMDKRFGEFEAKMDQRFGELESKMDKRFGEFEAKTDKRFVAIDKRFVDIDKHFLDIDRRFASIDIRFERIDGQFGKVYLMLGIIMATTALPALQRLSDWLG